MASTEQRSGFRLPWGSTQTTEQTGPDAPAEASTEQPDTAPQDSQQETQAVSTNVAEDEALNASPPEATSEAGAVRPASEPIATAIAPQPVTPPAPAPAPAATPSAARSSAARQPTRFLADLVRAMRATAEDSRTSVVTGLHVEGKSTVERIHARSAEEVDSLRRVADDDVAGIKEWSKTEVARIRAETEERIGERKQELELSLEGHAALIEREIEHVQARIAEYEAEMDTFFVRLDGIDDPAEFAALAAEMPEPPSLEEASAAARAAALDELIRETTAVRNEPVAAAPVHSDPPPAPVEATADQPLVEEPTAEEPTAAAAPVPDWPSTDSTAASQAPAATADQAVASEPVLPTPVAEAPTAPEAQAQPATDAEQPADAARQAEAAAIDEAVAASEQSAPADQTATTDGDDPRLAALGLDASDPASTEAGEQDGVDTLSEATIAARLGDSSAGPEGITSVVVVGLVSVASVAAFKRTLGKVAGVRSVGVSSGPEGEFVFRTVHDPEIVIKDAIPTLPGFGARVVAAGDGVVNVSARDPEAEG